MTLHALHVGKISVEKSLYSHKEITSEQMLRIRERILIKVAFTKSSEIPLLSKVGLKLNIQKTKIMASGPITSWQIGRETMETVTDFILGVGSKITADRNCNHEIKRRLLLGRNVMTNLDSILKNRDITLPTKVCLVKAMVFSVVMYGCESWTIKKVEHRRINAFELWCWRRLLRVQERSNQLDPTSCKEIQPVHPKGDQSWMFIGRTDAEAETPILWPTDGKS